MVAVDDRSDVKKYQEIRSDLFSWEKKRSSKAQMFLFFSSIKEKIEPSNFCSHDTKL
jgi:hypothetical protein